jgi:MoxR-like ATPase
MINAGPIDERMLADPGVSIADFRKIRNAGEQGDQREGLFYRYTPAIKRAVRVALAVQRPLLIFGPSGCGKSSLVFNLARVLGRRYYEFVVQSRSEARDLYYRFDAIRRLGEAQLSAQSDPEAVEWRSTYAFIEPGPLWWVYDPKSAKLRGAGTEVRAPRPAHDPGRWPPDYFPSSERAENDNESIPPAIFLIDEIDKADLDFANNLLVPLGSRQFVVDETGDRIRLATEDQIAAPLIVITSNRERELPVAFVRRCVVLKIDQLSNEDLIDLARQTFGRAESEPAEDWERIAEILRDVRGNEQVSPAEFLDSVRAIELLGAEESEWRDIVLQTSWTNTMGDGD